MKNYMGDIVLLASLSFNSLRILELLEASCPQWDQCKSFSMLWKLHLVELSLDSCIELDGFTTEILYHKMWSSTVKKDCFSRYALAWITSLFFFQFSGHLLYASVFLFCVKCINIAKQQVTCMLCSVIGLSLVLLCLCCILRSIVAVISIMLENKLHHSTWQTCPGLWKAAKWKPAFFLRCIAHCL